MATRLGALQSTDWARQHTTQPYLSNQHIV